LREDVNARKPEAGASEHEDRKDLQNMRIVLKCAKHFGAIPFRGARRGSKMNGEVSKYHVKSEK